MYTYEVHFCKIIIESLELGNFPYKPNECQLLQTTEVCHIVILLLSLLLLLLLKLLSMLWCSDLAHRIAASSERDASSSSDVSSNSTTE